MSQDDHGSIKRCITSTLRHFSALMPAADCRKPLPVGYNPSVRFLTARCRFFGHSPNLDRLMRRLLLTVLCAGLALGASPLFAAGNPETGKLLSYTCAGCHGIVEYRNAYPSYHVPKIAGQNEAYLVNALKAYKSGDRQHPTMNAQATSFSAQDIADISAYLAIQKAK